MIIFETQEFTGKSMASDETEQSLDFSEQFLWQSVISCYEAGSLSWQDAFYFDALYLGQCEESFRAGNAVSWPRNSTALEMLFDVLQRLCQLLGLNPSLNPEIMDNIALQMQDPARIKDLSLLSVDPRETTVMPPQRNADIFNWLSGEDETDRKHQPVPEALLPPEWFD